VGGTAAGWIERSGSWRVAVVGSAPALSPTPAPSDLVVAAWGSAAPRDIIVRAKAQVRGGKPSECVAARIQDGQNLYQLCLQDGASWELERVTAGHSTTLSTGPLSYAPGSMHLLEIGLRGATLTPSIDGNRQAPVDDSAFPDGPVGVSTQTTTAYLQVCVSQP
jgi:hypothetical protein